MRTARSLTVCHSHSICLGGGHACHACPPCHAHPPAMHAPHAMHTPPAMFTPRLCMPPPPWPRTRPGHACAPPPCGQNHRRLWKYNLAPTSLRSVTMIWIALQQSANSVCSDVKTSLVAMSLMHHMVPPSLGKAGFQNANVSIDRRGLQIHWANKVIHLPVYLHAGESTLSQNGRSTGLQYSARKLNRKVQFWSRQDDSRLHHSLTNHRLQRKLGQKDNLADIPF